MNAFTWILPATSSPLIAHGFGISKSYCVPVELIHSPKELIDSNVFILLRDVANDFLFARIYVERVDTLYNDDNDTSSYLLTINPLKSIRTFSDCNKSDALSFKTLVANELKIGFNKLNETVSTELSQRISRSVQHKFSFPTNDVFHRIAKISTAFTPQVFALTLLRQMTYSYPLSEMWGSIKYKNPFLNFAMEFARQTVNAEAVAKLSPWLEQYSKDFLSNEVNKGIVANTFIDLSPSSVDIDFEPIDENTIKTRSFVAHSSYIPITTSMAKTEDAEKRHQDILRDVSIFLKSINCIPRQTSSIDLALLNGNEVDLFEIKTLTPSNVVNQISKGIFQLTAYSRMLESNGYHVVTRNLIVEKVEDQIFRDFIQAILNDVQIRALFYDAVKTWPQKLFPAIFKAYTNARNN